MEKMVANKHVLHKNCFCCQQCERKLSLHNYSYHDGQFYCVSHYQQLSRKGNYNEGFGYKQQKEQPPQKQKDEAKVASAPKTTKSNINKQHEERWLQKNKGTDELDVVSTPKISKTIVKKSEPTPQVQVTKTPSKVVGRDSSGDVKGKLKINWPPEKKSAGVSPTQQTHEKNKISGTGKVPVTYSPRNAEKTPTKINPDGEIKKKAPTLSSSFVPAVKEQPKTTGSILPEKETKAKRESLSISERMLKFSVASPGKTLTVTNQKAEQKSPSPSFKTSNRPPSNWLDNHSSKDGKFVGFSPSAARSDKSPQPIPTSVKVKEISAKLPVQTQQSKVSKAKDEDRKVTASEFSKQQSSSEVYFNIPDYKSPERPRAAAKPSKDSGDEERSSEDEAEKTLQGFTAGFSSAGNVVTHKPELLHVIPKESVSPSEPGKTNISHSREEATSGTHGKPSEKTDSAIEQEHGGSQKKPVNKLMKLGSFALGKGPLSKLFTSSGNDKVIKAEPKEPKKPEAKPRHFGILFPSSSEQFETKMAAEDERKDKTDVQEKTEELKEAVQEKTQSAEPNILDINDVEKTLIVVVHDERKDETRAYETKMLQGEMTVTWEMHKDDDLAQLVPQREREADAQEKPRSPEYEQTTMLEIKHEIEDKTQKAEEVSDESEEENQEEDEEFVPEKLHQGEAASPEESEAEEEEQDAKRDKRQSEEAEMQKENRRSETPERSHSAEAATPEESDAEETTKGKVQDENTTVKEEGNWSEEEHQEERGDFVWEKPRPADPSALDDSEAEETPDEEEEQDIKREERQTDEMVKGERNWFEEENQFVPEKPRAAEPGTPEESDTEETTKGEVQDSNKNKTDQTAKEDDSWSEEEHQEEAKEFVQEQPHAAEPSLLDDSEAEETPDEEEEQDAERDERQTDEMVKEGGHWSEEEHEEEAKAFVLEKPHPAEPSALDDSEAEEEEEQDNKRDERHSDEDKDESETPERSQSPDSSTLENGSLHLLQAPAGETHHHTAPDPTDANPIPADLDPVPQSRETTDLFGTDPASAGSQDWDVSVHPSAAETKSEEAVTASFTDDFLGVGVSSVPGEHPTIQRRADEASSDEEPDQNPSNPQETFVPAALPEATSQDAFSLFDSDQTDQASNPFLISSQTAEQQGSGFDIFSSNDLFSQPPPAADAAAAPAAPAADAAAAAAADASTNQADFLDDFFGVGSVSTAAAPASSASADSLPPSAQTDLFALDIFASDATTLPAASEPSDANFFLDGFLEPNNNNNNNNSTEQTGNTVTSSSNSWMDDLLG
ncbi:uncharacterized protein V6R79_014632 [Siganus canaliculatus]